MKRRWIAVLLTWALWPLIVHGQAWVNFTVTRHVNTPLADATVDNAMTDISRSLQLDNHDCVDDTPCTVRFRRGGAIGTFGNTTDGLDVITTQAELDLVFGVTTHRAKVVTSVDFCAGQFNPSIIGCGRCNNFGFIVEDWVGGTVYVHEYGHNVLGCGHRDDCTENIMNTFSTGNNNSVNASECVGFGGKSYTALCGNVYDGYGGPLTVANGPYWLTCNVTVPAGQTLTIEPGVEIQCDPGLQITSQGTATADGSVTRITIYSNNDAANFPTATVDGPLQIRDGGILVLR